MNKRNKITKAYSITKESYAWLRGIYGAGEMIDLLVKYAQLKNLTKEEIRTIIKREIQQQEAQRKEEVKSKIEKQDYSLAQHYEEVMSRYPNITLTELKQLGELLGYKPSWAILTYLDQTKQQNNLNMIKREQCNT